MKISEYQKLAKVTCAELGDDKLNLSHMILGFYSEYNEIKSAERNMDLVNYGEELTDSQWYFANYCTYRNYAMQDFYEKMYESRVSLEENLSKLADLVKKYIAYNKQIDIDREIDLLKQIAYQFYDLYRANDLNIYQCLQNNIDKLKARYGDKFSEHNAINRNLDAERKELEK